MGGDASCNEILEFEGSEQDREVELKAQLRDLGCEDVSRTAGCEMLDKINCCNSGFPGLESQKVAASEQDVHLPYTVAGQLHCHRQSARPRPRRRGRLAGLMPRTAARAPGVGAAPQGAGVRAEAET